MATLAISRFSAPRPFLASCCSRQNRRLAGFQVKSNQVNTLPKAKSQAKDKRAKVRHKYTALRCKVGMPPLGFEAWQRMSRVAFRVFPAGRAGDTRAAICAISCFVSRFRVCVCMYFFAGALERRKRLSTQSPVPFFPVHLWARRSFT